MSFGGPLNLRPFPTIYAPWFCVNNVSQHVVGNYHPPGNSFRRNDSLCHKGSQSIRYMKHPSSWSSQHLPFEAIW